MACVLAALTGCASAAKSRQNAPPTTHLAATQEAQTRAVRMYFGNPLEAPRPGPEASAPERHMAAATARARARPASV